MIATEPLQKLRVVRVDGEDEAEPVDPLLAVGLKHDGAVVPLEGPGELDLPAAVDEQGGREDTVAHRASRVSRVTRAEDQRVGPGGADDPLERQRPRLETESAARRSAARFRIGSA